MLNVYDLTPANDYLVPVGLGLHHSGVEILGREYSFGSGGGIFDGAPKEAAGARFRFQIDLGAFDGGSKELNKALDDLRPSGNFGSDDYHLVKKNCNHFCNALVWRLLRQPIPAYVNRWADLGNCCSCLLPKKLLEDSPVGGGEKSNQSFVVPTGASMNRGAAASAFTGTGQSLGGASTTAAKSESEGLLSKWTRPSHAAQTKDDLTDRRDKARKAALARFDRASEQQQPGAEKES